ncbi:hypothetical protein AVEN_72029-1 [Araneus ventricosus]|uniref:Transposase Tc1-like domain-containing protein n=1 Tax=Araneus ventricosus TaxID=182803 RepID=A0A4Y2DDA2_ARAVE|nr:hypothetical protein AVEN_72029-1 [Araneus ventricosus]
MRVCHSLKISRRIQNKCSLIAVLGGKELAILRGTNPQLDQVQESARPQKITNQRRTFKEVKTIGERFMVKEESAASVGTRPWTPEGRSLTLSIAFMLYLGIMERPSRLGVVQRLWDQYQSEDSVSRRHVSGRPRVTTPAEDRFLALSARRRRNTTVPQLVADHFVASGRRISAPTVRRRLHNAGFYAKRPVVCVPSTDDREGPAYVGQ